LTGKLWPKLFEVSFDFDPDGRSDAGTTTDADSGGSTRDAGRDAAPNLAEKDAGARDGGMNLHDADGEPLDADAPLRDAAVLGDTAASPNDQPTTSSRSGCGCRAASGTLRAPGLTVLALLCALLFARRKSSS
jgi:MYXO-CTERM domain-containing protein